MAAPMPQGQAPAPQGAPAPQQQQGPDPEKVIEQAFNGVMAMKEMLGQLGAGPDVMKGVDSIVAQMQSVISDLQGPPQQEQPGPPMQSGPQAAPQGSKQAL